MKYAATTSKVPELTGYEKCSKKIIQLIQDKLYKDKKCVFFQMAKPTTLV